MDKMENSTKKTEIRVDERNASIENDDGTLIHDWNEPGLFLFYRHYLETITDVEKKETIAMLHELLRCVPYCNEWKNKKISNIKFKYAHSDMKILKMQVSYDDGIQNIYNEKRWFMCSRCGYASQMVEERITRNDSEKRAFYKCPSCEKKMEIKYSKKRRKTE